MRAPSFRQGTRGPETSSSTEPMRQRSPMRAPVTSTPARVRFSPNAAGSMGRRISAPPPAASPAGEREARLVGAAVVDAVGLLVARHAERADRHRPDGGVLDDPGG